MKLAGDLIIIVICHRNGFFCWHAIGAHRNFVITTIWVNHRRWTLLERWPKTWPKRIIFLSWVSTNTYLLGYKNMHCPKSKTPEADYEYVNREHTQFKFESGFEGRQRRIPGVQSGSNPPSLRYFQLYWIKWYFYICLQNLPGPSFMIIDKKNNWTLAQRYKSSCNYYACYLYWLESASN